MLTWHAGETFMAIAILVIYNTYRWKQMKLGTTHESCKMYKAHSVTKWKNLDNWVIGGPTV